MYYINVRRKEIIDHIITSFSSLSVYILVSNLCNGISHVSLILLPFILMVESDYPQYSYSY